MKPPWPSWNDAARVTNYPRSTRRPVRAAEQSRATGRSSRAREAAR
jgi:hypothetical protein